MEFLLLLVVVAGIISVVSYFGESAAPTEPTPEEASKLLATETTEIEDIKLSEEQQSVFESLEYTDKNMFITGKAGTGKSLLLRYFERNTQKSVVIVAPTGIAALNVGGETIHSLFKIPIDFNLDRLRIDASTKELLSHVDVVIVDEVSMVRSDLMEAMNIKLQLANNSKLPFGGVQIVLFGDLYQLPPVVREPWVRQKLEASFGGYYFFDAPAIKAARLETVELQTIFRQKDAEFKDILNAIRVGDVTEVLLDDLNQRAEVLSPKDGVVTLAGKNRTVSDINHRRLAELPGEEFTYQAVIEGELRPSDHPTEEFLKLKVNAQVMVLRNDTQRPRRWVNGSMGVIKSLGPTTIGVLIDGVNYQIEPVKWEKIRYTYNRFTREVEKEVISSFEQYPLRLAWAVTVHKSQGQTYSRVRVDLSDGAFAHGQTYVALSRCTSLAGLFLASPLQLSDIIVDPRVVRFMGGVSEVSPQVPAGGRASIALSASGSRPYSGGRSDPGASRPPQAVTAQALEQYLQARIGKSIEFRYQSKRVNSAHRWRKKQLVRYDANYLYTSEEGIPRPVGYKRSQVVEIR